jgi:transcriptional regulator with XRE-family HTH domain
VSQLFPKITSSSRIDRRYVAQLVVYSPDISSLPVARQVRELRAALSVNKSELARILRVTRPTVYDWLDGGEPNADNVARIGQLLRLVLQARVSSRSPLLPRFVRSPLDPGSQALLDLLDEETIAESAIGDVIRRAKGLGDAMDTRRRQREARLRAAGFEEPDDEQRTKNLATNVALMPWSRD